MKSFESFGLEQSHITGASGTSTISERFRERLQLTPLNLWSPGDQIASEGTRLLIGVAPYSISDLRLLDQLLNIAFEHKGKIAIDVFDVLSCTTMRDFDKYVPGIGQVFQTPVIGAWHDGMLVEAASGAEGRKVVQRYLPQLSPTTI